MLSIGAKGRSVAFGKEQVHNSLSMKNKEAVWERLFTRHESES